ncbi:hypothetical protein [Arthrobacter humicola]
MPDVWGAEWWDAWQAFGTVGAVAIAMLLALYEGVRARRAEKALASEREQRLQSDRFATAALVSAWVETQYEPSADGTHYLRRGTLYLANESNEPVFNVHVVVGVGQPVVQIGPLAVPAPLPVLPPRRHRSWDISLGLLANGGGLQIPSNPVAKIFFSDAQEVRWNRDFEGRLREQGAEQQEAKPTEDDGMRQLGDPSNSFNPIWTAMTFLNLIRREDPPVTASELAPLLAENAPGWARLDDSEVRALGHEFANYGMAAHAWYPAPQVAYVRLVHERDQDNAPSVAGYVEVRAQIITLVFYAGVGWRVFSAGAGSTEPDWIEFPTGAITDDPRGHNSADEPPTPSS